MSTSLMMRALSPVRIVQREGNHAVLVIPVGSKFVVGWETAFDMADQGVAEILPDDPDRDQGQAVQAAGPQPGGTPDRKPPQGDAPVA